jgi:predicted porin
MEFSDIKQKIYDIVLSFKYDTAYALTVSYTKLKNKNIIPIDSVLASKSQWVLNAVYNFDNTITAGYEYALNKEKAYSADNDVHTVKVIYRF